MRDRCWRPTAIQATAAVPFARARSANARRAVAAGLVFVGRRKIAGETTGVKARIGGSARGRAEPRAGVRGASAAMALSNAAYHPIRKKRVRAEPSAPRGRSRTPGRTPARRGQRSSASLIRMPSTRASTLREGVAPVPTSLVSGERSSSEAREGDSPDEGSSQGVSPG